MSDVGYPTVSPDSDVRIAGDLHIRTSLLRDLNLKP
jgi:hypothetical protein